jgi:GntR family transcriptional regulator
LETALFESISINEDSGVPIWIQLRDRILFLIKSQQLKPGDELPTVREFATQLGINYNTVHKVYQDLQADGYISSKRGRRSTVAESLPDESKQEKTAVDVAIEELVRVAKESGMSQEELIARISAYYKAERD